MFSPKSQQRTWFIIDDLLKGNFHVPSPLYTQDFYKIFLHLNISLRATSLFFFSILITSSPNLICTSNAWYQSMLLSFGSNFHQIQFLLWDSEKCFAETPIHSIGSVFLSLRMRIAFLRGMWKSFNSPLVFSEGKWEAWNWVQWNLKVLTWKNKNNI